MKMVFVERIDFHLDVHYLTMESFLAIQILFNTDHTDDIKN